MIFMPPSSPETELLKTLTLEELKRLEEKLGFRLKAKTKRDLVPSLSRAIRRKKISFATLVREVDKVKHPHAKKRTYKKGEVPRQIRKIIRILKGIKNIPQNVPRKQEEVLRSTVANVLIAKGYQKKLAIEKQAKPIISRGIVTKSYTPDIAIADEELGDIAIEVKVVKYKESAIKALEQAKVYRKRYRHVIVFLYDAGNAKKPEVPVIIDDETFRREKEKLARKNIYVQVNWAHDLEKAMLKKIKRHPSKKSSKMEKISLTKSRRST